MLGIANRHIDMFMDQLDKTSKILGVRSFLGNPGDSEGNPIIFTETKNLI